MATATCVAFDQGAMQHLTALAQPHNNELGRLGPVIGTTLVGWGFDCMVQAMWAQLAWQALSGAPSGLRVLWGKLRGAWTGVGLLVAYASLSLAALAWPQMLRGLKQLPYAAAWAVAAVALALALGWVALRLSLGVPAAAAEQLGGKAASLASWRLTRGKLGSLLLLLPLGSACAAALSALGSALPEAFAAQGLAVAVLSAAVQSAFAGLPGTMYWAWRNQQQKA